MSLPINLRSPYLILIRPANVVTSIADVLAGIAISGLAIVSHGNDVILLIISTVGLYAGGIVFNDIFDAETDKVERPERMIPSGKIGKQKAIFYGLILMTSGILAAFIVNIYSGLLATGIAFCALVYDKYMKHHLVLGPLFMGLCRGGNLLLGTSLSLIALEKFWWMSFLPIIFIAAVTMTSRGENFGNNKMALSLALFLDTCILFIIISFGIAGFLDIVMALPFLALWVFMNYRAKITALKFNKPETIKNAVKTGILSLIPLDACYAAGFGNFVLGIVVLALLPLSIALAKKFAVT